MSSNILIIILGFILFSYNKVEESPEVLYIISTPEITLSNGIEAPPPPPELYYGNENFVLLEDGKIYYYHLNEIIGGGCIPIHYDELEQISLLNKDLKEISIEKIDSFLNLIIPDSIIKRSEIAGCIASQEDTIINPAFKKITNHFAKKGITAYNIRNLTKEEMEVFGTK